MQGIKVTLTPEQEQYLIAHFPHKFNSEIAQHLGISVRTVNRLSAARGLVKSQQLIQLRQRKAGEAASAYHYLHPVPPGFRIPGGEKYQFKKGQSPRERMTPERYAQVREQMRNTRNATIRKERARITFGLPQRTRLKLTKMSRERSLLRYYLRKRGYIIDDTSRIAYYDTHTRRGPRIEKKKQPWYTFQPHSNYTSSHL